jgi:hypothetical protein
MKQFVLKRAMVNVYLFTPVTLILVALIAFMVSPHPVFAQEKAKPPVTQKPMNLSPDSPSLKWDQCTIAKCAIAVLHGDPAKEPFDLFARFPAGSPFPKHWHSHDEYLVGIKGKMIINLEDGTVLTIGPGGYGFLPGGMTHWGNCTNDGECVFYGYNNAAGDLNLVQ